MLGRVAVWRVLGYEGVRLLECRCFGLPSSTVNSDRTLPRKSMRKRRNELKGPSHFDSLSTTFPVRPED
jgi:hypothetical protein